MSQKKNNTQPIRIKHEVPKTLEDHAFFGLKLDPEQTKFRDAIWKPENKIIFVNAKAGTGKTLLAVACGTLLVRYGLYDQMVYLTAAGSREAIQGFLPGSLSEKSMPYRMALYQGLVSIGEDPERVIRHDDLSAPKDDEAFVIALSNSYIRGVNIKNSVYIIDEAQNFDTENLMTALSRVDDNSKVIVIGHDGQVDMAQKSNSGFTRFLEHFRDREFAEICTLSVNHRGQVSQWADELK